MLEKWFHLREHGTTVKTEAVAGLTTFLTMVYIVVINPEILALTGMDRNAVFAATCLTAALGSFFMAVFANWPLGMAPGMGLNAFFTFTLVQTLGIRWEEALGAIFISGGIFLILTLTGIRTWLISGIPPFLKSALVAGMGFFLAIIALSNADIVVAHPITHLTMGNLHTHAPLFTIFGFFIIAALDAKHVQGAILIGILITTLLAIALGYHRFEGVLAPPPSLAPLFLKLDLFSRQDSRFFHVIVTLTLIALFDASGTLIGITKRAELFSPHRPQQLKRAFFADSLALLAGAVLGTSNSTVYLESTTGIQAGGRTGLTALFISVFFIATLFFAPLAASVPVYATAPALLYVAGLMVQALTEIDWQDHVVAVVAPLTAFIMPFTYSIANGLAFGFISYVILKTLTGKRRDVHPATVLIAGLFLIQLAFFQA